MLLLIFVTCDYELIYHGKVKTWLFDWKDMVVEKYKKKIVILTLHITHISDDIC